ncbi:UNVERIFIED_CONTAM: hypothetical protein GTU68_046830 [Idotea baltica]|nr:hypothetical protein [Idotea baltica]
MNQHQQGILDISVATNQHPLQNLAEDYARRILEKLNYIGVMTIEFFQKDDVLSVNEIAPRVHNSGHWTIDGAKCSQFENHLRAINDLPLGSTQRTNNSAMLNLISHIPNVEKLLDIENCHLHHYGKTSKPGRKVGHVTLCESTENELAQKIKTVQAIIQE